MDKHVTIDKVLESMNEYESFEEFCAQEVTKLSLEEKAQTLSFLSLAGYIPTGYQYPVDNADSLLYLLSHTPEKVCFKTRPRLLANCKITGINLNRLSDFDIYLLDASSNLRVDLNIYNVVMPENADLRNIDLSGLFARRTDFSKAQINPQQLLDLSEINHAILPKNLPLGNISDKLTLLAPEIHTLNLTEENIKNCDLSCTDYPLKKLFKNCNKFEGVIFPISTWNPFEYDDDGKVESIAYSISGCSFKKCDLRHINNLTQGEVNEASFSDCLLPNGLHGIDMEHTSNQKSISKDHDSSKADLISY